MDSNLFNSSLFSYFFHLILHIKTHGGPNMNLKQELISYKNFKQISRLFYEDQETKIAPNEFVEQCQISLINLYKIILFLISKK